MNRQAFRENGVNRCVAWMPYGVTSAHYVAEINILVFEPIDLEHLDDSRMSCRLDNMAPT